MKQEVARSSGTRSSRSGTRKRRRIRSPHPGVVLIKPDPEGRHPHWRARFEDPDAGKLVKVRLDPITLSTVEARRDWAIRKARELAKRRVELADGAVRATGTPFAECVDEYFKAHSELRKETINGYRTAADKLIAWASKHGVQTADDLTRARLVAFRDSLIADPKRAAVQLGRRGQRQTSTQPRSAHSINRELRSARTVLGYLRDRDLFARLSHDDLRRALKRLPTTHERIEYLKPHELQKLLEAALRHDAETFKANRDEHAGRGTPGTTPRYEPIAPFVAFVLLTGMRFGEAIALDWRQVELDALDNEGHKVGEIHLAGADTKTHHARTVGLEVSPALHALLASMQLAAGGMGPVFKLTRGTAEAAGKRLIAEYAAPKAFGWQMLRRTCGTFLTNAPGIFGASSAYRSAKQLGHSVTVAERHYLDVARGIPREARTLEAAMQLEDVLSTLVKRVSGKRMVRKLEVLG